MRKTLRDVLWATAVLGTLLGVVLGVRQLVSRWHPSSRPVASVSDALTATRVQVDQGVSLDRPAPNFTLTDQFGHSVSLDQFRGKTVILSFIDSRCTTVCPLTAVVLRNVRYDLGRYRSDVQLVAVNANPVANKISDVYQWSKTHNMLHEWEFLTGSDANLKSVWAHYYVDTEVIHGDLIQHEPAVYVIGPHGHERWVYLNSTESTQPVIAAQVAEILKHVAPLLPGHVSMSQFPAARELTYLPGALGPVTGTHRFKAAAIAPGGRMTAVQVGYGGHPVFLDFFATWCPDCQEEVPALVDLTKYVHKHGGPQVMAVDLRLSEPSTQHVVQYVQKTRLPFMVALDQHGTISDNFGVNGLPTQVLVSAGGRILWYHQGLISYARILGELKSHGM